MWFFLCNNEEEYVKKLLFGTSIHKFGMSLTIKKLFLNKKSSK